MSLTARKKTQWKKRITTEHSYIFPFCTGETGLDEGLPFRFEFASATGILAELYLGTRSNDVRFSFAVTEREILDKVIKLCQEKKLQHHIYPAWFGTISYYGVSMDVAKSQKDAQELFLNCIDSIFSLGDNKQVIFAAHELKLAVPTPTSFQAPPFLFTPLGVRIQPVVGDQKVGVVPRI